MKNIQKINQHIYITSDEEIKEEDWFYLDDAKIIAKYINVKPVKEAKKIILTTDQDLIKDGVQAIDDEFLEWFVKNPSCEWVWIKEKQHFEAYVSKRKNPLNGVYYSYKIIIPKKLTDLEIAIKLEGIQREEPKQQSAVEWLEFRYKNNINLNQYDFEQAKEMEKEQLENAWYAGDEDGAIHEFEYYYNETFKKD